MTLFHNINRLLFCRNRWLLTQYTLSPLYSYIRKHHIMSYYMASHHQDHESSSALHHCSSTVEALPQPLSLMDGPVKTSQDAGNRIIANRILDQEGKKKRHDMTCNSWMNTDEKEASNSKKRGTSLIILCRWLVIDNVALLRACCN